MACVHPIPVFLWSPGSQLPVQGQARASRTVPLTATWAMSEHSPPAPSPNVRLDDPAMLPACAVCGAPRDVRKVETCSNKCRAALSRQRQHAKLRGALLVLRAMSEAERVAA